MSDGTPRKGSLVSGDDVATPVRVDLVDPDGVLAVYVRALALLPRDVDWVLVGGLATNVRIARLHRATNDIDTVSTDVDRILEVLVALEDTEKLSAGKVQLHNPDVEVDVMHSTVGRELPLEQRERSFALARRWAMRSASPIDIVVKNRDGVTTERLTLQAASRAALVALKTLSFPERRGGSYPHKVGSDIQDLYRLVASEDLDAIAESIVGGDAELAAFLASELQHHFAAGSSDLRFNHVRLRRFATNIDAASIAEADLTILGSLGDLLAVVLSERE